MPANCFIFSRRNALPIAKKRDEGQIQVVAFTPAAGAHGLSFPRTAETRQEAQVIPAAAEVLRVELVLLQKDKLILLLLCKSTMDTSVPSQMSIIAAAATPVESEGPNVSPGQAPRPRLEAVCVEDLATEDEAE